MEVCFDCALVCRSFAQKINYFSEISIPAKNMIQHNTDVIWEPFLYLNKILYFYRKELSFALHNCWKL